MFDMLAVSYRCPTPSTVYKTVHEHRAPTDNSVELLKEMESASLAKIIETVTVRANGFDCVIHKSRDAASASTKFLAIWSLNGRKHTTEHTAFYDESMVEALPKLRDLIAIDIANIAMQNFRDL